MSNQTFNRRSILKKTGGAAGGLAAAGTATAVGAGTAAASGDDVTVTIYPRNTGPVPGTPSDVSNVHDAVDGFLTQLEDAGAIPGYQLDVSSDSLVDKYGDEYDLQPAGNCDGDWFNEAQNAIEEDSDEEDDVYLFVTKHSNFASATGNDAWKPDVTGFGWVGTNGDYDVTGDDVGRYKNLAIQEICHEIIDETEIDLDIDHEGHKEHSMGEIKASSFYSDSGPVTPGATFYEADDANNPCHDFDDHGSAAHQGDCDSSTLFYDELEWDGTHVQEVSDCTVEAIKATYSN